MAKFECDVVCFVNIKNLDLASERLLLSDAEGGANLDQFIRESGIDVKELMAKLTEEKMNIEKFSCPKS